MILNLVASFPASFSPIRATSTHFKQKNTKYSTLILRNVYRETIFPIFARGYFEGVDRFKKMRVVRTIHVHPCSRRELRHASENVLLHF